MSEIARNVIDLIGNTPMLELKAFGEAVGAKARILAKLEYFNPGGSVKDRVGYAMILDGESKGIINKKTVIIEPTSGNTGIGLAFVCAAKGYRLILTMPESMSLERRNLLKALGAEIELTPASEGMPGAIRRAEELAAAIGDSYIPQQFRNPSNPEIHRRTTAEEIWRDTQGIVDFFIAGVGTGGTITGVGEVLKDRNPNVGIIAVEPYDSPVLSGGKPGSHKLQGIGAGFIPDNMNMSILDDIIKVKTEEAYHASNLISRTEGLLVGISSGAALHAASIIAQKAGNEGKTIVALLPDSGERYLSTPLYQHG